MLMIQLFWYLLLYELRFFLFNFCFFLLFFNFVKNIAEFLLSFVDPLTPTFSASNNKYFFC